MFLLVIIIIVLGVYLVVHYQSTHKALGQRDTPTVTTAVISPKTYQEKIQAIGYFLANQGITLKSAINGRITYIHFDSGQQVKEDDVLVEFENSKEQGALAYAKAKYALSKLTYQRNINLEKTGAVSEEALDEAKTSVDSDQASLQQAQANYDETIVKAPFSGRVGLKNISVGDYLNAGDALVTLQSLDPMFVDFSVAEKYLSKIKPGGTVELQASTSPDETTSGVVKDYETVINTDAGMIDVRASVANPEGKFLPGGYAEVTLYAGKKKTILAVPQTAIIYDTAGNYVYLVEDGKAKKQIVKLGEQVDQNIVITSGLSFGELVVVAGTNKVYDGSQIIMVDETNIK